MTIASATNKSGPYFYNGSATSFAYKFKISNAAHIRVVETVISTGLETDLALNTDYTVTGVGADAGGNVVITPARASGKTATLVRKNPFTQEVVLENQGAYLAKVVEGALDDAVARDQQLAEQISRAVVVPVSADPTDLETLIGGVVQLLDNVDAVVTVAGISGAVTTVAANAAPTAIVAGNIDAVVIAASNMATIIAVPALATQVAADRVQTGQDRTAVAANKALVDTAKTAVDTAKAAADADVALTHADVVLTHADAAATAADRVQTGLDRIAAAASAASIALPASPVALNYLRRNAGNTAYEVRTPAQTASDLSVLRFDAAQGLTSTQQAQARTNLGLDLGYPLLHVQDQKTSGTQGGSSTAGANTKRTLNTVRTNEIGGASLATSSITLPAGTYYVEAKAPGASVGRHRLELYDESTPATLLIGPNAFSAVNSGSGTVQTDAVLSGRFTLTSPRNIALYHYTELASTNLGLGVQMSFGGAAEIYSEVEIWKLK